MLRVSWARARRFIFDCPSHKPTLRNLSPSPCGQTTHAAPPSISPKACPVALTIDEIERTETPKSPTPCGVRRLSSKACLQFVRVSSSRLCNTCLFYKFVPIDILEFLTIRPSNRSTACLFLPGIKCPYKSTVTGMELWPICSFTYMRLSPSK